ncbi:MAG: hypothetical protein EKK56_02250 [Flavobacteriaceae bacterium]|nr:MAG: hypothetical protein EKK56_02250 [Flavobacteriaceae bacterium]
MKGKFYLILVLLVLTVNGVFAQRQETLAKFIITDATMNGVDVTPTLLSNKAYTVFYTSDNDGLIYMANVWPKSNSQSYGPMYSIENQKKRETYETYEADIFYFNWRYINTYDNKKGTAKVQVIKIYKPQGVAFTVKIIPENLDITIYKGYMEGTIDFSDY